MKKMVFSVMVVVCLSAGPAYSHPTGAPLMSYPVEPCRILDTRTSLGPIPGASGIDVYVRGQALPASHGAQRTDCKVPAEAEAVVVNITSVFPTSAGYLKINGTGRADGVMGAYSRHTFEIGSLTSNEIQVSLCNRYLYPADHAPCGGDDGSGRYSDFQIVNMATTPVHVTAEVVGYLARIGSPSTAGDFNIWQGKGNPSAVTREVNHTNETHKVTIWYRISDGADQSIPVVCPPELWSECLAGASPTTVPDVLEGCTYVPYSDATVIGDPDVSHVEHWHCSAGVATCRSVEGWLKDDGTGGLEITATNSGIPTVGCSDK